jgi:membrane protein implicated in regulation of membrane protease activity
VDDWIWWLVIAGALIISELFLGTFVLLMLGIGALAAAIVGVVGAPGWVQLLTFAAVSVLTLALVRPWMRNRWFKPTDGSEMGLAVVEGADALVTQRVDPENGQVKIEGELWRARPYDATRTYEPGERVRVVKVDGATALVWRD